MAKKKKTSKTKAKKKSNRTFERPAGSPPPGAFTNDAYPGKFLMFDHDDKKTYEVDENGHWKMKGDKRVQFTP